MQDSTTEDRSSRFVNSSYEEEVETIDDNDFIRLSQAIYSFFHWGPLYCHYRRVEYGPYIENEEIILQSNDRWLITRLSVGKTIWNRVEKTNDLVISELSADVHNVLNKQFMKELKEKIKPIDCRNRYLEKKIANSRYPLIAYYTSNHAMKFWFNKRIELVLHERRRFRFKEREEKQDILNPDFEDLSSSPLDIVAVKRKLLSIYQNIYLSYINWWVLLEYRNLSLNQSNLIFYGNVFRGEILSQQEFQEFQQKFSFSNKSRLLKDLSKIASTDLSTAMGFLKTVPRTGNTIRLLHEISIIRPEDKVFQEFYHQFPNVQMVSNALSIDKLSRVSSEKEVLLKTPHILILDIQRRKSGIWHIKSLCTNAENTIALECVTKEEKSIIDRCKSLELSDVYDLLSDYPHLMAWQFNKWRCYSHGAMFASRLSPHISQYHNVWFLIIESAFFYLYFKNRLMGSQLAEYFSEIDQYLVDYIFDRGIEIQLLFILITSTDEDTNYPHIRELCCQLYNKLSRMDRISSNQLQFQ